MNTETVTYTEAEILDHRRQWLHALRDPDRKQVKNVLCKLDDDGNAVPSQHSFTEDLHVALVESVDVSTVIDAIKALPVREEAEAA